MVIIATPHYEHPALAIEAFKHGLKPMTPNFSFSILFFLAFFTNIFSASPGCWSCSFPEIACIKRITWIITDWYRPQAYHDSSTWRSTWRTEGGGALINQNPHQLDLWQWICGVPVKVYSKNINGTVVMTASTLPEATISFQSV